MRFFASTSRLTKALQEQGLIPPSCRLVDIVVGTDAAMVIRYEVLVTEDQLPKLAAAFQAAVDDKESTS